MTDRSTILSIILIIHCLHFIELSKIRPLDDPDVGLNVVELIENHGYVCESHTIVTEDAYILTYHRIPHGKTSRANPRKQKPVVLLMHGILASSADYVNMGPDRSLGYILADDGYDVWIANARGNAWSRKHVTLNVAKDAKKFFDFSFHEIGYYDLPAAVNYILGVTGNEKLFYVGHSQGGTVFLVMASTRPEYNEKIRLASLMAPASFMEHHNTDLVSNLSQFVYKIEKIATIHRVYEIPFIDELRKLGIRYCTDPQNIMICENLLFGFVGKDEAQFDQNKIAVLLSNTPSYASLKQYLHYFQLTRNGGFSQYDHGRRKNLQIYGTTKPPDYNLSKISAPVAVYYGQNDATVNLKDVKALISKLPNVVTDYLVPYDSFNHLDFMYAIDVVKLVYEKLRNVMKRF